MFAQCFDDVIRGGMVYEEEDMSQYGLEHYATGNGNTWSQADM